MTRHTCIIRSLQTGRLVIALPSLSSKLPSLVRGLNILLLLLCIGTLTASAAPHFDIYSVSDMRSFRTAVENGQADATARLMNDITLDESNWLPIGTDYEFTGEFDGCNHTIYGLRQKDRSYYGGLFGQLKGGIVKNLYVHNPDMYYDVAASYVGTICGFATEGTRHSKIQNCHVTGAVVQGRSNSWYWGGIVGKADVGSEVTNCTFQGKVFGKSEIGGIVGELNSGASVEGCILKSGSIVQGWSDYVGGIVGYLEDTETYIRNCFVQDGSEIRITEGSGVNCGKYIGCNYGGTTYNSYWVGNLAYYPTDRTYIGDNNTTMWEVEVVNIDNLSSPTDITIYNDIGATYAYYTRRIKNGAFANTSSVRSIRFADYSSGGGEQAYKWIGMEIEDYAFDNCPQLEAIYMSYTMHSGRNHTVMLGPGDVYPSGSNAFSNCPKLKIYVDLSLYDAFVNDSRWGRYKDIIVPTTSMRVAEFEVSGVAYNRNHQKNGSGDPVTQTGSGGKTVYQMHVVGAASDLSSSYNGLAILYNDPGETYAYCTTRVLPEAFMGNTDLYAVRLYDTMSGSTYTSPQFTIGSRAFADCPNLKTIDLVYGNKSANCYTALLPDEVTPEDTTMLTGSDHAYIRVWPDKVEAFKNHDKWKHYADRIVAWEQVAREYPNVDGLTYEGFLEAPSGQRLDNTDLCSTTAGHNDILASKLSAHANDFVSLDVNSFLSSPSGSSIYYTHVNNASNHYLRENKGVVTVYNDIGATYKYRTVMIDSLAFKRNPYVRQICFADCYSNTGKTYEPLQIMIQKGAFIGCDNLRTVDLVYQKYMGTNTIEPLTPKQVVPAKGIIEDNQRIYFRVSPDQLAAFKGDANWAQYADHIVPYTNSYDIYTVDGVVYNYFPVLSEEIKNTESGWNKYYYSNKHNEAFRKDYITLRSGHGAFNMRDILTSDTLYNSKEVWYLQIAGVDNDALDGNDGKMTIYNNIGAYYDYKTIAVDAMAFRDNTHIKSVGFSDLSSGFASNDATQIGLILPNRAFEGCTNLKYIDMVYYVTDGTNHYEALGPKDIIVGDSVFNGCPDDFEIRVTAERYGEFVSDPNWSQYRDHIVIYDYTPTDASPMVVDGVTYEYAAHLLNGYSTQQKAYMAWSLWNLPVQMIKSVVMTALFTSAMPAVGALSSLQYGLGAFAQTFAYEYAAAAATYGLSVSAYFAEQVAFTGLQYGTEILLTEMGCGYLGNTINLGFNAAFYGIVGGLQAATMGLAQASLAQRLATGLAQTGKDFAIGNTFQMLNLYSAYQAFASSDDPVELEATNSDPSADLIGQMLSNHNTAMNWWSGTAKNRKIDNVYHLYIGKVDNDYLKKYDGEMRIYNDVGATNHYRTVGMDRKCMRGNQNLKKITFQDIKGWGAFGDAKTTFQMAVPDSAFAGCTNLERLNMFMECTDGTNSTRALGPDNFCLMGTHVFDGCPNLKVYVSRDRYDEFKNDSIWSKLTIVVDKDYEEPVAGSAWGAYYGYNFDQGSLWSIDDVNGSTVYNMHIVKPDNDYLRAWYRLTAVTDYGTTYNYNTTYVNAHAFQGNEYLHHINFSDTYYSTSRCYTTPSYEFRDSCFADCPDLERVDMYYLYRTTRPYQLLPLTPSQVKLRKGVFDNSPKVRFNVFADKYAEFLSDKEWAKYIKQIRPNLIRLKDETMREACEYYRCSVEGTYTFEPLYQIPMENDSVPGMFVAKESEGFYGFHNVTDFDEFKYWGPLGLKKIPGGAFKQWYDLNTITIPESVESIGSWAFHDCRSLYNLIVPASVKWIGSGAFGFDFSILKPENRECPYHIHFRSETPPEGLLHSLPELNKMYEKGFEYKIFVPAQSLAAYKKAVSPWYVTYVYPEDGSLDAYREIDMQGQPGTLKDKLGYKVEYNDDKRRNVFKYYNPYLDSLRVVGPINSADVELMVMMAKEYGLTYLDLSDASLPVANQSFGDANIGGSYINGEVFKDCRDLQTLILPSCVRICDQGVVANSSISTLVCPGLTVLGEEELEYSSVKDLIMCGDKKVSLEEAVGDRKGEIDLYVPYDLNAAYSTDEGKQVFKHIYSPYLDNEVFRILSSRGYYNFSKLGLMKSTHNWFTGSSIRHFDELYTAINDTALIDRCFADCRQLESISLPTTITYIDNSAFSGCESLKVINVFCAIPPRLESENVFDDLPDDYVIKVLSSNVKAYLKAWPEKVARHIVNFANADPVVEIHVSKHGTLADSLNVKLDESKMVIANGNFGIYRKLRISGELDPFDINMLASMAGQLRYKDGDMVDSDVPLTNIVPDVMPANANLRYLDLSDAVLVDQNGNRMTQFYTTQFQNCDALETIILPRTLVTLPKYALAHCNKLKHIVLGEDTRVLADQSVTNCPRLTYLTTFHPNLTFEGSPFTSGYTVDTLFCAAVDHPKLAAMSGVQKWMKSVYTAYQDLGLMKAFATHGVQTEHNLGEVKSFRNYFKNNQEVKDLTALSRCFRVTELDDGTFASCKNLKRIAMPDSVVKIGSRLFEGCDSLRYIDWQTNRHAVMTTVDRSDPASPFYGMPDRTLIYCPQTSGQTLDANVINTADPESWEATKIVLDDTQPVEIPYPFITEEASIKRTFTIGKKSTVYLPMALDETAVAALGSFYQYQKYDYVNECIVFRRVSTTEPGVPYLFLPAKQTIEASGSIQVDKTIPMREVGDGMFGTWEGKKWYENPYDIYGYSSAVSEKYPNGQFVRVGAGASVRPMRGWFKLSTAASANARVLGVLYEDDETITGIIEMQDGQPVDDGTLVNVYSVGGNVVRTSVSADNCLEGLPSGIYIVKGKKIIVP